MKARIAAMLIFSTMAVGACTRVQTVTRPALLPTVAPPVLTPVKSDAVACLADDTYTALVNRERMIWTAYEKAAAIIAANNSKAAGK